MRGNVSYIDSVKACVVSSSVFCSHMYPIVFMCQSVAWICYSKTQYMCVSVSGVPTIMQVLDI